MATDTSGVQIIIETLSGKVKQEVSLLNDVDKINLTVSKNTFLRVKKGLNRELRVILKKEIELLVFSTFDYFRTMN